jgi:hypothetical protein
MGTTLPPTILDAPEAYVPPAGFPVEVELAPGALRCRIFLHRIHALSGPVDAWSYVTEGLVANGQKEAVFTVAIDPGTDPGRFPTDPLRFASTLMKLAGEGRRVDAGGITELGGSGFMGRRGLTYVVAQPLDGVPLPANALAVIALTAEEIEVLKVCGQTRVLTALGQAYRHYPFPPWMDRRRGTVISPQSTYGTMLLGMTRVAVPGSVRIEGTTILLRLRPEAAPLLGAPLARVPVTAPLALTTEIDPASDGCFTWQAGQRAPAAITPPGSRAQRPSGCFLGFIPEQYQDGGQLFEDGMMMYVTTRGMDAIRRALATAQPLSIPAYGGKLGLVIEWIHPPSAHAPVSAAMLAATAPVDPEGRSAPPPPMPPTAERLPVRMKQRNLLISEAEVEQRLGLAELTAYCDGVTLMAEAFLSPYAGPYVWEVMVEFTMPPGGGAQRRMKTRGEGVSSEGLQRFYDKISAIAVPVVRYGPVAFQIVYEVGG